MFTEILHIVMPTFNNALALTTKDREILKNCYDILFAKAAEMNKKKIVSSERNRHIKGLRYRYFHFLV